MDFVQWLVSCQNIVIFAAASFGLPSFFFYCSEVFLILWHSQFHNSFYALFVLRAFPDLAMVSASYVGFRLPAIFGDFLLPFYRYWPRWLLASNLLTLHYAFEADNLATMFILLNRITAIAIPLRHENLWRKLLPLAAFIIYGIPLYFVNYLYGMDAILEVIENDPYNGNRTTFSIAEGETNLLVANSFLLFASSLGFFAICTFINLAIFGVYKWKKRGIVQQIQTAQNAGQQKGMDKVERKLLAYALCTFVGHGLITLVMIGFYVAGILKSPLAFLVINAQTPWTFDFGSIFLPSWLLLWASGEFRKQWMATFLPKILHKFLRKWGIGKTHGTEQPPKLTAVQPFAAPQQSTSQQFRKQTITQIHS